MTNTNLIERLREDDEMLRDGPQDNLTVAWHTVAMKQAAADCSEAAALIEQQEAVIASLSKALEPFADGVLDDYNSMVGPAGVDGYDAREKARAALLAAKTHLDPGPP